MLLRFLRYSNLLPLRQLAPHASAKSTSPVIDPPHPLIGEMVCNAFASAGCDAVGLVALAIRPIKARSKN